MERAVTQDEAKEGTEIASWEKGGENTEARQIGIKGYSGWP